MNKVLKITEEELSRVEFIQTINVDINGLARGKIFPVAKLSNLLEDKEEALSALTILGTKSELPSAIKELGDGSMNSNMALDKDTLQLAPWSNDGSVALVFYDIYDINSNKPCPFNPRLIAKEKLRDLENIGYKLLLNTDNEFRIFDQSSLKPITGPGFYSAQYEAGTVALPFVRQLNNTLKRPDIEMESWNMSMGQGQLRVTLKPYMGMEALDKIWLFREVTKYVAYEMNFIASFMTSPLTKDPGNELQITHALLRKIDLKNIMTSEDSPGKLSEVGEHWLAGLLKHSRALTAIMCPTVNCYRRIKQISSLSPKITWNYIVKGSSYNVKCCGDKFCRNYIEDVVPSSSCNIYLAVAAMIVAGLDGIKNNVVLMKPGSGDHCEAIPLSLEEALDALDKDKVLRNGLGNKVVDWYIAAKKETDVKVLQNVDLKKDTEDSLKEERTKYFNL